MNSSYTHQHFGDDPTCVRECNHYVKEYVPGFVDKWDELINWESRAQSEGDFFIEELRKRGAKRILDVATGTGFHSCRLIEAGFEVISADGSAEMLSKAFANGRARGHCLRTVQTDWRCLNRDIHSEFDAVICLGNSFTHLFDETARRKALAEFYSTLSHDGVLVLDQRNYDAIVDGSRGDKTAKAGQSYYYCGHGVSAQPEHVDDGLARFRYDFPDGASYHLNMFPLRRDYTTRLLLEVGFQTINTYADFKEHDPEQPRGDVPDYFIHVAEKEFDFKEEA